MKKFLLLLALLVLPALGQVDDWDVSAMGFTTGVNDTTVDNNPDKQWMYILTTSGEANKDTSNVIYLEEHDATISINGDVINVDGTLNIAVYFGFFKGFGNPDNTGYTWKHIATLSGATTEFDVSLADSTWNTKFPKSRAKIAYVETGNQQNRLAITVHAYRPGKN